jgi:hypothetical protein
VFGDSGAFGVGEEIGSGGVKVDALSGMVGGWFVGDFSPTLLNTNEAEVACKKYKRGDSERRHVHKVATELTLIVSGRVRMNGREIGAGEIVTLLPGESSDFQVIEDAVTVCVKIPSVKGDKYFVEEGAGA